MTNTGSVTFNMNDTSLLVNGTMTNFSSSVQYLFPLDSMNISFSVNSSSSYHVKMIFDTGYDKYVEVKA